MAGFCFIQRPVYNEITRFKNMPNRAHRQKPKNKSKNKDSPIEQNKYCIMENARVSSLRALTIVNITDPLNKFSYVIYVVTYLYASTRAGEQRKDVKCHCYVQCRIISVLNGYDQKIAVAVLTLLDISVKLFQITKSIHPFRSLFFFPTKNQKKKFSLTFVLFTW